LYKPKLQKGNIKIKHKLEAKYFLPNINCTQAADGAEEAEKCRFCP